MNSLKEAFSRKNMLKNLNFFGELNLGLILTAVGIVYFKNPNHFAFGGTSGLSILLADLFPKINVGGFMWIINLILVVLGFVFLGIKTMGWTIYSSFALSFFVSVCEALFYNKPMMLIPAHIEQEINAADAASSDIAIVSDKFDLNRFVEHLGRSDGESFLYRKWLGMSETAFVDQLIHEHHGV